MFGIQFPEWEQGIQHGTQTTNKIIERFIWRYRAVHGIVGGYEQAGIQMHLHQYAQIGKWACPGEIPSEKAVQRKSPCS